MFRRLQKMTGKHFSPKLKTQLIASFMGMSFIVLLLYTFFSYMSIVSIVQRQLYQTNLKQLQQLEFNINAFQNEVDKIMRLLVVSMDFQDRLGHSTTFDLHTVEMIKGIYTDFSQMVSNYEYIESIYYYGKNGIILGVTAKKNIYLQDAEKEHFFYHSDIYEKVRENTLGVHWFGGYTSLDFDGFDDPDESDESNDSSESGTRYITAARGVNYLGSQTAIMVVNINERHFTSIYGGETVRQDNNMYIMEPHGRIISHTDESRINRVSDIVHHIDLNKSLQGSLNSKADEKSIQNIYYRFKNTDWIMVNEIPLSLLFSDINKLRDTLMLLFVIGLATAFGMSIYWIFRITKPLDELKAAMRDMEKGKLGSTLSEPSWSELGILGRQFNKMSLSIAELIYQIKVIEKEKRNLEIESLQAQINPHFLYNTLNTIKYMAVIIKAKNIVESITALGNILGPIYKNPGMLCSIKEELEYLRNYIRIMNYRFGEGIKVHFNIPDALQECNILRFILQPMIENSFQYGIAHKNGKGIIRITAGERDGDIFMMIEDDGDGMDDEKLKEVRDSLESTAGTLNLRRNRIGLINVHRRIKLHFGEKYGIHIESRKGIGTTVVLRLPKDSTF